MLTHLFDELAREPYFLPLAGILAILFLARLVGERR